MNKLSLAKRAQIIGMLVEGNSLRATSRMSSVAYNTVLKLVVDIGKAAEEYQDKAFRNLPCKRIQVDEIWSFCYAKAKNVRRAIKAPLEAGNVWTWTSIDPDSRLVPCWHVGTREAESGNQFILDLASRMAGRVQIVSDGLSIYTEAVRAAFGNEVDYGMLVKLYSDSARKHYIGCRHESIIGEPDKEDISTSYVERQNLTMRMGIKRFARRTNAHSKKIENHAHAVALHFIYYNYGRIHKTLGRTPAMEIGISDHVWSLEEIAKLID